VRLFKVKVSGYKRLAKDCQLNLDTDPVCIVGPNAAGKSSLLDALVHLNHSEAFDQTEKTRIPGGQAAAPQIEARFLLDDAERELLKEIPDASEVRQFLVFKYEETGVRSYSTYPYASRDLSYRHRLKDSLGDLQGSDWFVEVEDLEKSSESQPDPLIGELLDKAIAFVNSDEQKLEEQTDDLEGLARRLEFLTEQAREREEALEKGDEYDGPEWPSVPSSEGALANDLIALAAHEVKEHPNRLVMLKLQELVPKFVKFDDLARKLDAKYDLRGEEPKPGSGIHNFLALAGTSWSQALEVVEAGDPGWKTTYLEDIGNRLRERAALIWGQNEIDVKIDLDGSMLSILLSMQAHDFIGLDDHSDGLQQFMALRAFTWRIEEEIKPIILIDEAELHLHYDAQADLVSVFEEQKEAAKIIYTTHSAGCLPRDLGLGVRGIVPETKESAGKTVQTDHSRTVNRFWTEGRGFSPLLMAMGAGAFAFSATQWAVITEGMSDALLLPTLLREATGNDRLRYQAVPSFAEATADEIARFDLVAGRVAFLADGDEGGRNHVARLTDNGIGRDQVVFLGGDEESGFAIEDVLAKGVYLKAINTELDTWHGLEFPADQLPEKGRGKAVEKWCSGQTGHNGKPVKLSKVDVAQRVLDQRFEAKLLAKAPTMRKVHENIMAVFEGAPDRIKQLREEAAEASAQLEETKGVAH
jgi:energy-coupling factor transporter ATP-binding protein EcfA2